MIMINQIANYLSYDFVRNALIAGSLAGILGAVVGYLVARDAEDIAEEDG